MQTDETEPSVGPADTHALKSIIRKAAEDGDKLEIIGGGSKYSFGAPRNNCTLLKMTSFNGVTDYDPAELVLTAGAATPLCDIEALLLENEQMLAFEPYDHGPIYGDRAETATLGGIIAANVAGSRRLTRGSARDHFLGFEAVSGRGEHFVAGGKVVKNVTGYDLPKLLAGSWGQLAALTQITVKVMPLPRAQKTLWARGLEPCVAQRLMAQVMGAGFCVASAAYTPKSTFDKQSITSIRLEGFEPSVEVAVSGFNHLLPDGTSMVIPDAQSATAFWTAVREVSLLDSEKTLWRINTAPSQAPQIVRKLEQAGSQWYWDWAAGLTLAVTEMNPQKLRQATEEIGGFATLIRASTDLRTMTPTLHPQLSAVARLEKRIRGSFDPKTVFETARFMAPPDAY